MLRGREQRSVWAPPEPAPEPARRDPLGRLVAGTARAAWRHRVRLAPGYAAAAVFVAGSAVHGQYPWPYPAATAAVAAGAVNAATRRARWRLSERRFATGVTAYAGTWITYASVAGPTDRVAVWALTAGTSTAWAVWLRHRRIRARIRLDADLGGWPERWENALTACGMPGHRVRAVVAKDPQATQVEIRGTVPAGQTVGDAAARLEVLETAMGFGPGTLQRIVQDGPQAGDYTAVYQAESPFPEPLRWSPELAPKRALEPWTVGTNDMGQPVRIRPFTDQGTRRMLIGGESGSGKSVTLLVIGVNGIHCVDVVLWGADLKADGATLRPLLPCLDWFATTPEEATLQVQALEALSLGRGPLMDRLDDKILPSPDTPGVLWLCDEIALLIGVETGNRDAINATMTTATEGRALAASMAGATQICGLDSSAGIGGSARSSARTSRTVPATPTTRSSFWGRADRHLQAHRRRHLLPAGGDGGPGAGARVPGQAEGCASVRAATRGETAAAGRLHPVARRGRVPDPLGAAGRGSTAAAGRQPFVRAMGHAPAFRAAGRRRPMAPPGRRGGAEGEPDGQQRRRPRPRGRPGGRRAHGGGAARRRVPPADRRRTRHRPAAAGRDVHRRACAGGVDRRRARHGRSGHADVGAGRGADPRPGVRKMAAHGQVEQDTVRELLAAASGMPVSAFTGPGPADAEGTFELDDPRLEEFAVALEEARDARPPRPISPRNWGTDAGAGGRGSRRGFRAWRSAEPRTGSGTANGSRPPGRAGSCGRRCCRRMTLPAAAAPGTATVRDRAGRRSGRAGAGRARRRGRLRTGAQARR
ncbi:hypothetical protein ACFQHO_53430 [Actinomadura yumaensis]|uniref:hypothetical protein n=1 Tax=Actinomadura yumaensis TaxID=111807 RepID=UPI00360D5610